MTIFYSPSQRGFFHTDLHTDLPDDGVEIDADLYGELLCAQELGARIEPCPKTGRPLMIVPGDTENDRRSAIRAAVHAQARRRIMSISPLWRQLNDIRHPSPAADARFTAIDAIRASGDRIEDQLMEAGVSKPDHSMISTHPFWPEFD